MNSKLKTQNSPFTSQRRFFVRFSLVNSCQAASLLLNLALLSYLGRVLGMAEFGRYSLALAIVTSLTALVDLGLPLFGTRALVQQPALAGQHWLTITALRLVLAGLVVSGLLAFVPLLWPADAPIIILAGLWLLPYALSSEWFFQGLSQFVHPALVRVAAQAIALVLVLLLVQGSADLWLAALATPVAQALAALLLLVQTHRVLRQQASPARFGNWRAVVQGSLPLGVATFLAQLYAQRIDHVLLKIWYPYEVVALYSGAYTLHLVVVGIVQTVILLSFPPLSAAYLAGPAALRQARAQFLGRVLLVALPLSLLLAISAGPLLSLLFGASYAAAAPALAILALDPLIIGVSSTYAYTLIAAGYNRELLPVYGAGAVAGLAANLLLIPLFGITGAALATILAEAAVLCAGRFFMQKHVRFN